MPSPSSTVKPPDNVEIEKTRSSRFKTWIVIIVLFLLTAQCARKWPRSLCTNSSNEKCYKKSRIDQTVIQLFDDILMAEIQPKDGKNIFFHETSCSHDGIVNLDARQACSIESAAKANPDSNVFVMFASPVGFERDADQPILIQALQNYSSVHFRNVNIKRYAKGTPAAEWVFKSELFNSPDLVANLSELLRMLSLFKFGGTYLDMDIMTLKSLANIGQNYAAFDHSRSVSSSVLNFESNGVGQLIAEKCIREYMNRFKNQQSKTTTSNHLSRVLTQVCRSADLSKCRYFTVLNEKTFYPLNNNKWWSLFDPDLKDIAVNAMNESVAVRSWSKLSAETPIQIGSAFDQLAKEHCPRVYAAVSSEGQLQF